MFPGDEKPSWARIARNYAACASLADVVDGKPAFHVYVKDRLIKADPSTHQYKLEWEARIGGFFYSLSCGVGHRYHVEQYAMDKMDALMIEALETMTKRLASNSDE